MVTSRRGWTRSYCYNQTSCTLVRCETRDSYGDEDSTRGLLARFEIFIAMMIQVVVFWRDFSLSWWPIFNSWSSGETWGSYDDEDSSRGPLARFEVFVAMKIQVAVFWQDYEVLRAMNVQDAVFWRDLFSWQWKFKSWSSGEIWGFHGGDDSNRRLLVGHEVFIAMKIQVVVFWRDMRLPWRWRCMSLFSGETWGFHGEEDSGRGLLEKLEVLSHEAVWCETASRPRGPRLGHC